MKWAERCFGSLRNSSVPNDVFVVDNGSTDGTQEFIKKNYPEVIFQQSAENMGFGKANNIGLQYALDNGYDYVYLLNQDAWVMEDTFERIIEAFKDNKEYGILSPMQLQANLIHIDKNFLENLTTSSKEHSSFLEQLYFHSLNEIFNVEFVMAAHWMLSRKCILSVGGFSPTFRQYGEDDNYINRVKYHKYKIGVVPLSRAVHDREYRSLTPKKLLHQFYTNVLILYSSVGSYKRVNVCKYIIKTCIELRSLTPLYLYFKILCNMKSIRTNRILSCKKSAFLSPHIIPNPF